MQNVGNESGKSKTSAPWFKCFTKDYFDGTRRLSAEARGIYFDCLCIMYRDNAPLPFDDKWMSLQLVVTVRRWRAIRDQLIAAGKLEKTPEGYVNKRAEKEIENRTKTSRKPIEKPAAVPKNPIVSTCAPARSQTSESRLQKEPPSDGSERVQLEKGRLTLFNGLRQYWLDEFGGDEKRLDLALTQAAGYVQPNSFRPLEAQVSAQLARVCAEKRARDARYASASAAKAKPEGKLYVPCPAPLPRDEAAEDRAMRARVKVLVDQACGAQP